MLDDGETPEEVIEVVTVAVEGAPAVVTVETTVDPPEPPDTTVLVSVAVCVAVTVLPPVPDAVLNGVAS